MSTSNIPEVVENQTTNCDIHSAYTVQQLYKKISEAVQNSDGTVCIDELTKNVFPVGLIQSTYDGKSAKRLDYILSMINCWYLSWEGTVAATKLEVPLLYRRKGFIATYKDDKGGLYTQRYVGDSVSDAEWTNEENWEGYSFDVLAEDIQDAVAVYLGSDEGKEVIRGVLSDFLDDALAEYFADIQQTITDMERVIANALARHELAVAELPNNQKNLTWQ